MPGDLAPPQGGGGAFLRHHHTTGLTLACRCLHRYIPDPSLKRQTPRATGSPNLATWAVYPALLPNRSNALRSSS